MNDQVTAEIPLGEFDLALLPSSARQIGTSAFRDAVVAFFQTELQKVASWIQVTVNEKSICVAWRQKGSAFDPVERAVNRLKSGDYPHGVQMLRLISKVKPDDVRVNFNLGMALSDLGELDEAVNHLQRAVAGEPDQATFQVALGVALYRKKDLAGARAALEQALDIDGDNAYALRSLGGCLLALGEPPGKAAPLLRRATELMPTDQQAWCGLGQALEQLDDLQGADAAYQRAIGIDPNNQIADIAKKGRSRIAQASMRKAVGGGIRLDAVMYCLAALQTCEKLSPDEVKKLAMEIAAVGTKGLDPNDSTRTYTLRSLPGEFTGLQLLCYMHVTWQQVAPHLDTGFDLSEEYAQALTLHDSSKGQR